MKEAIGNMKQMADHYFGNNEHTITLTEDTFVSNQRPLLERKRSWEEKEFSKIPEVKENIREHLTATYWG